MKDFLNNEQTRIVLIFDAQGTLVDAAAEGIFSVKGVPAEIAAGLPARVGATKIKAPTALTQFFTGKRLGLISDLCKERAADAWMAETAANKPQVEELDLEV